LLLLLQGKGECNTYFLEGKEVGGIQMGLARGGVGGPIVNDGGLMAKKK
jgi:hypothetical protein